MKIQKILILGLAFLFLSCATSAPIRTEEHKAYLDKVYKTPLEFYLPISEERDAWSRTQAFITKYSSMKIQIATESVIQTYNPSSSQDLLGRYKPTYGYSITKIVEKDKMKFNVSCSINLDQLIRKEKWAATTNKNAHILAHYIKTGELPFPELIDR